MPNNLIVRNFNGTDIVQSDDGYLNATAMCQACGRLFADYNRLDSTESFVRELSTSLGIPIDEQNQGLIQSRPGAPSAGGGSWVHPQVAYHLAMWCSPAFAAQVTEWIHDIRTKR